MSLTVGEITIQDEERQPCEVWTRVMGYHRPTSQFNIGKQQEFKDRMFFTEDAMNGGKGLD